MYVIVTGSGKGIGKTIAQEFARTGYDVLLCSRNESVLSNTASELQLLFPSVKVHYKPADLSDRSQVEDFGEWCLGFGAPAILVNNAGLYLPGNCHDEPEGNLETMININLYSAYHLTRKLLPSMMKAGAGHIFNICSVASLHAYEGGGGYSISKFALNGFSQNLRHELKTAGIKVTAVFPGAVFTDSWKGFDNSGNRIMETDDIAKMVVAATGLSVQATVEEIHIRPQLGDL
jgi:short-subunit dehydrogenase